MKNKNKKKISKKGLIAIIICSVFVVGILCSTNFIFNLTLRSFINTFEKVQYENQLVPYKDENGFYTFKTDRELKIMHLTDLHIGGGHASPIKDRKTIYEAATMIQKEKPDLVILGGDNTFAVPAPIFNGGGTFNNKMPALDVIELFEKLGVYWTTVFGNHDTEVFDFYSRQYLSNFYKTEKFKYCIYDQNFSDSDENKMGSMTNQCIQIRNNDNSLRKLIMLMDSNSYVDNSIKSVINWDYDIIHNKQVEWAKNTILNLSPDKNNPVKSLFFFHIPIGEYKEAYLDLENNGFIDTATTKWYSGFWNEEEVDGSRIWYGGISNKEISPKDQDELFETIGPDGINSLEGIFCGHDHMNNAVVNYRGVMLSYGNSMDNLAYKDICLSGLQRGATVIKIKQNGLWTEAHKNAYLDYGVSATKYYDVFLDRLYYPDYNLDKYFYHYIDSSEFGIK